MEWMDTHPPCWVCIDIVILIRRPVLQKKSIGFGKVQGRPGGKYGKESKANIRWRFAVFFLLIIAPAMLVRTVCTVVLPKWINIESVGMACSRTPCTPAGPHCGLSLWAWHVKGLHVQIERRFYTRGTSLRIERVIDLFGGFDRGPGYDLLHHHVAVTHEHFGANSRFPSSIGVNVFLFSSARRASITHSQ